MQKLIELKNKKGFTLIEMLIVILIIVILLAIAVPAVAAYRRDALRTQDEGAVETILTALEAALIRETPVYNDSHTGDEFHSSAYLDYDALATPDATLPQETQDFYKLVGEYLGPNFQGNFKFIYTVEDVADGVTLSKNGVAMIAYWRSDSATSEDSVMMYYPVRTEEIEYFSEMRPDLTTNNDNIINNIIHPLPCLP